MGGYDINLDSKNILRDIECFALDMDGTFYLGDRLIQGSLEFLEKLAATGRSFVFLTNNSSKSKAVYIEKLAAMGVKISDKQIVSSGQATIHYLKRELAGKRVYLLGNPVIYQEFVEHGIILDEDNPEVVVTSFDTSLDYSKMCKVCNFVREGKVYIATHPDYNCPVDGGYVPDIGAIHAFIHASTGRMPDKIIGKPYPEIMTYALEQAGFCANQSAMVGDRLYTDIMAGQNIEGIKTILVLSGESTVEDIEKTGIYPDLVFDDLYSIGRLL